MTLLLLLGGAGEAGAPNHGTSTFPGLTFEVAFGHAWNDPAMTWTDISGYVYAEGISISSGRSDELQPFDASSLTFTLDNRLRTFDPAYVDGPFYGDIVPVVPIRVRAWWDGVTYPLFYGFVQDWPQMSNTANRTSDMSITATDVLELFAQVDYTANVWTLDDPILGRLDSGNRLGGSGDLPAEFSGERVTTLLDLVGQPTALRDVDRGVAQVSATVVEGSPRDELQALETAEAGGFFQWPNGQVAFLSRHAARERPTQATSQVTFTDADDSMPYAGLKFSFDKRYVLNDIRRARAEGAVQIAQDPDSIARYFRRRDEITDLLNASDADAKALADLFLAQHREPVLRPEPLVIDAGNDRPVLFPQVLGRQLQDRITLVRTPQDIGDPVEGDYRIEGISHQIDGGTWLTTWTFSPVDTLTYWTLDDPVLGLLDAGNLIGA